MATLVIAGLVMAATFGAVTNVSRAHTLSQRSRQSASLCERLRHVLDPDLLHASEYLKTSTGFVLRTDALLSRPALALRHQPSEVSYEVRQADPRTLLVRQQRWGDGESCSELISTQVRSITVEPAQKVRVHLREGWRPAEDAMIVTAALGEAGSKTVRLAFRRK